MTYLHFLNCITLTFAPLVLTYRSTNISIPELNGYASLVSIFFYYLILQGFKLFILACLPSSLLNIFNDNSINDGFSIFVEISRSFLDCIITIFGMIYCFKNARFINKMQPFQVKILCVGLGWSFSNSITHYLIPLWQARQIQFDYKYIFMAIKSNLYFLIAMSLATIIYNDYISLSSVTILDTSTIKKISFRIYVLCIIASSIPSFTEFMNKFLSIDPWTCIIIEVMMTLIIVFITYVSMGNKTIKSE